jgi:predicted transcriptional regulator
MEEIESALEFDKETGTWRVLGAAWQVADTAERREIQQVLGRSVDPMTPTEVAERLGKSRQNIQNMLGKMLDEGKVEQVTRGRYTLMSPVSPVSPELLRETKETRDATITHARAA